MAKFKGFNNQQLHQLLSEHGYTGPAQKDDMDAFVASSPAAASMLGRYNEMARERIEGKPMGMGMAEGGEIPSWVDPNYGYDPANPRKPNMREMMQALGGGKSLEELQAAGSYDDLAKQSSEALYGVVGSNEDTRDFNQIMQSDNIQEATAQATADMYQPTVSSYQFTDPSTGETGTYYGIKSKDGTLLRGGYTSVQDAIDKGASFGVTSSTQVTQDGLFNPDTSTIGDPLPLPPADEDTTTDLTDLRTDLTPFGTGDDTGQQQQQQTTTGTPSALTYTSGQGQTQLDDAQKAYADAQKTLTDAQQAFNNLTDPSGLYTNVDEAMEGAFGTDFNADTDGKNQNIELDKTWTKSTLGQYTNITADSTAELKKPGKYWEIAYPDLDISISTGHQNQQFAQGRLNILTAAVKANSNIVTADE